MFYLSRPFCHFWRGGCTIDPRSRAFADRDLHEIWDRAKIHTTMAGEGAAAKITPGLRQMWRLGKPRGSQGLLGPAARGWAGRGRAPGRPRPVVVRHDGRSVPLEHLACGLPSRISPVGYASGSRPRAELGLLVPHAVLVRHFMKYAAPGRRPRQRDRRAKCPFRRALGRPGGTGTPALRFPRPRRRGTLGQSALAQDRMTWLCCAVMM